MRDPRSKTDKNILQSIILGIILGFLLFEHGGFLFIASVFLLTLVILNKYFTERNERDFIMAVFVLSFCIRALILVGIHFYNEISGTLYHYMGYTGNCIFGDSASASVTSQAVADVWRKECNPMRLLSYVESARSIQFYIYSLFYYLVGKYELWLKFINIMYGTITGIFVYLTAREIFNTRVARYAYVTTMFFPTLILWSVANLKEPIQTLMLSMWIYSLVMIRKGGRRNISYFLLSALTLFFSYTIRPEIAKLLFVGGCFGFFLSANSTIKKIVIIAILLSLAAFLSYGLFSGVDIILKIKLKVAEFWKHAITWQSNIYKTQGYNYKIYPEKFYRYYKPTAYFPDITNYMFGPIEILYFLLKAAILFLTVPLPWMATSLAQAAIFPYLIFWYIILVFSFMGFMQTVFKNNKPSFIIAGFLIALLVPMALISSNIGSVFRHRDLFTPFIIIYASYGFWWLLNKTRIS